MGVKLRKKKQDKLDKKIEVLADKHDFKSRNKKKRLWDKKIKINKKQVKKGDEGVVSKPHYEDWEKHPSHKKKKSRPTILSKYKVTKYENTD